MFSADCGILVMWWAPQPHPHTWCDTFEINIAAAKVQQTQNDVKFGGDKDGEAE